MKLSRRNLRNLALEQERLARGKPLLSKYEAKQLTEDERRERVRAREMEVSSARRVRKGVLG